MHLEEFRIVERHHRITYVGEKAKLVSRSRHLLIALLNVAVCETNPKPRFREIEEEKGHKELLR